MRSTAKALFFAGLLGGSLALAGCSSERPASAPAPPAPGETAPTRPGETAPTELGEAALTVLSKGGSYAADEAILYRAGEELIRRCMSDHGHRYVPVEYGPTTMMSLTDDEAHPDVAWRRAAGYGLRPDSTTAARHENDRHLDTLSTARREAWGRALRGDGGRMSSMTGPTGRTFHSPLDGCIAESGRILYGSADDADRANYYLQDGRVRLLAGLKNDAGYRSAVRRWSTCMRERGYRYPTPAAAREAARARYEREGATRAAVRGEIAVALADAGCATGAGLARQADRLVRETAGALPAGMRRELNRSASARLRGMAKARHLLPSPR